MNTKESTFRAQFAALPLQERVRKIDEKLRQNGTALACRNEKLLGLRPDFDALTMDFWRGFGHGLGCEDPERTIADQRERVHSVGHISIILLIIAMTILAAVGARAIFELVLVIGVAGVVTLGVIIAAPLRQIARARQVAAVLGREQEPFWLTGGSIGLSNLGVTPPAEAKWWWKDHVVFVFVRHIAVRFSIDAFTGDLLWEDPVPAAGNSLSQSLASQILKHGEDWIYSAFARTTEEAPGFARRTPDLDGQYESRGIARIPGRAL
jgi:hypothetical protein